MYARLMPFAEAVEKAVGHCIKTGILAEFLSKNQSEAIAVSIFEYDEEAHLKNLYEDSLKQREDRIVKLLQALIDAGRTEDLIRAITDPEYRKQLYMEEL